MYINKKDQDLLACAIGALIFTGLSFSAALFPLIVS